MMIVAKLVSQHSENYVGTTFEFLDLRLTVVAIPDCALYHCYTS